MSRKVLFYDKVKMETNYRNQRRHRHPNQEMQESDEEEEKDEMHSGENIGKTLGQTT